MDEEYNLVELVEAAKKDGDAADNLLRQYLPFIKSETAKFMKRIPYEGRDDDLSIAMFAFYEAALNYEPAKGAFLAFAATSIRNRLIDFNRKEQRHMKVDSLDENLYKNEGEGRTILDELASERDIYAERAERSAAQEEIEKFAAVLAKYDLTLSEVADDTPKQRRTLKACHQALAAAKKEPELIAQVEASGKIPLKRLVKLSGVSRKTLERHRKYLVAIFLAYTNGFYIIRDHLKQVVPEKEGQQA